MTNDKFQMTKEIRNPNDEGNSKLGSAPASGALFGALAETPSLRSGLLCDSRGRKSQRPRRARSPRAAPCSDFWPCHSLDIRHSDFVIVESLLTSAPAKL